MQRHLQPEAQEHAQLVVEDVGGDGRIELLAADRPGRQVERRAVRDFGAGGGVEEEGQPEPAVRRGPEDLQQLLEPLLGRPALGRVNRDQGRQDAAEDPFDGRHPVVQERGALAGEHGQDLLARLRPCGRGPAGPAPAPRRSSSARPSPPGAGACAPGRPSGAGRSARSTRRRRTGASSGAPARGSAGSSALERVGPLATPLFFRIRRSAWLRAATYSQSRNRPVIAGRFASRSRSYSFRKKLCVTSSARSAPTNGIRPIAALIGS